jgi:hypothetical protein
VTRARLMLLALVLPTTVPVLAVAALVLFR